MLRIGFTGTQKGMTVKQACKVMDIIEECLNSPSPYVAVHHGDCIGADSDFHDLMNRYSVKMYIHPPINEKKRAFRDIEGDVTYTYPPKDYLTRNRDIVDNSDILIATPKGEEMRRSGTWATIRYARSKDITTYIIYPDGTGRNTIKNGNKK